MRSQTEQSWYLPELSTFHSRWMEEEHNAITPSRVHDTKEYCKTPEERGLEFGSRPQPHSQPPEFRQVVVITKEVDNHDLNQNAQRSRKGGCINSIHEFIKSNSQQPQPQQPPNENCNTFIYHVRYKQQQQQLHHFRTSSGHCQGYRSVGQGTCQCHYLRLLSQNAGSSSRIVSLL